MYFYTIRNDCRKYIAIVSFNKNQNHLMILKNLKHQNIENSPIYSKKIRTLTTNRFRHVLTLTVFVGMGFPTGEMILALEAYLIRDHFTLQLVSHAPMFLVILVIYFFIPESTRWLISKKMYETACKQVLKIAETNNTSPPTNISYYQKESGKIELSPTVTKNESKGIYNSCIF